MPEDSPLSSMGVSGKSKLDRTGNERQVFRVVGEKNVEASLSGEGVEPRRLRFMIPGMNRSTYSTYALLTWITVGAARFCTENSIVRNVAGGQTADGQAISFDPIVVEDCYTGCGESSEILLIHHPFVVTEGEKSWSDGSASRQKRQDVGLRLKRRSVSLWFATIQYVAGDADEGRTMRVQARYDRRGIRIMEVGKQRQIWRSKDMVDCLFRRGSPPAVELTVKPGT